MKYKICGIILLMIAIYLMNFEPLKQLENVSRFYRQGNMYDEERVTDTPGENILEEYDFIIIGAGTTGSVIANRLSENPKWKILLLEAGEDETPFLDVSLILTLFQQTNYDWNYKTEPQDNACLAMNNNQCNWPRGKSLGGTSSLNGMIYSRGHRGDYDRWAELGNTGWSYDEVLPYFKKSENIEIPELINSKYHSIGGPLNVAEINFQTPLISAFLKAAEELGHGIVDYNGETMLGFSRLHVNQRNGTRCSASKAFLRPIRHRTNLHISMNTRVTKIQIDPLTKRATGVEFTKNSLLYSIKAKKEVILTAGALNSPHLLMLSGVGPKEHLEEMDIPVIQDLKVGHNLQEHIGFLGSIFLINDSVGISESQLIRNILPDIWQFLVNGRGPFTSPSALEGIGFIRTKYAEDERPDIEFLFASTTLLGSKNIAKQIFGLSDEFHETVLQSRLFHDSFLLCPILLHPKSRGVVKLKDKDPWSLPKIFANSLTDDQDIKTLIEGTKYAIKMSKSKAFHKYGSNVYDVPMPGCSDFEFGTDNYWGCAIRHLTASIYHASGTCKMGPATDKDAVVDPELKVYGIEGLRVADASIIPFVPTGHTNAPCYMIGEKVYDLILEYWKDHNNQYSL